MKYTTSVSWQYNGVCFFYKKGVNMSMKKVAQMPDGVSLFGTIFRGYEGMYMKIQSIQIDFDAKVKVLPNFIPIDVTCPLIRVDMSCKIPGENPKRWIEMIRRILAPYQVHTSGNAYLIKSFTKLNVASLLMNNNVNVKVLKKLRPTCLVFYDTTEFHHYVTYLHVNDIVYIKINVNDLDILAHFPNLDTVRLGDFKATDFKKIPLWVKTIKFRHLNNKKLQALYNLGFRDIHGKDFGKYGNIFTFGALDYPGLKLTICNKVVLGKEQCHLTDILK
jgi:hypothetical protein